MNVLQLSIQSENMSVISALAKTNPTAALARDQMYMLGVTTKDLFVRKLVEDVTAEEISNNAEMQDLLINLINLYVDFRNKYKERTLLYSGGPNVEAVATMKQSYDKLVDKLPESRRDEIKEWVLVGSSDNGNDTNSGGCYIATCVYGSYDCPQVWTLRRYRDYTLDETWYGRLFIKCYYAVSPKFVKWFGKYEWFKKPWKKFLDGMVERLNSEGIADTKYNDKY